MTVSNVAKLSLTTAAAALLALCSGGTIHGQKKAAAEPVIKNATTSDFQPSPIMPQCFVGALQRVNVATGGAVFLVRADQSGCTVPLHWHTYGEQITVVSGTVTIQMNSQSFSLAAGGYAYIPSRHKHVFRCSGPCVHFVQSDGPYDIHYVNKTGREISLEDALKGSP